jgi:hypothetical protein
MPLPMRHARACAIAAGVALLPLGCTEGLTTPQSILPPALPVTLTLLAAQPYASRPPAATIEAARDSVVAHGVIGVSGCYDTGAYAGFSGGALVLTITSRMNGMSCLGVVSFASFRLVAHGVPAGRFDAVLQTRDVGVGRDDRVIELARQNITLP